MGDHARSSSSMKWACGLAITLALAGVAIAPGGTIMVDMTVTERHWLGVALIAFAVVGIVATLVFDRLEKRYGWAANRATRRQMRRMDYVPVRCSEEYLAGRGRFELPEIYLPHGLRVMRRQAAYKMAAQGYVELVRRRDRWRSRERIRRIARIRARRHFKARLKRVAWWKVAPC